MRVCRCLNFPILPGVFLGVLLAAVLVLLSPLPVSAAQPVPAQGNIQDPAQDPVLLGDVERRQALYVQPGETETAARERITALARHGDLDAVRVLGLFIICGTGGPSDPEKGLALLRDAAEKGHAWAQIDLALSLAKLDAGPEGRRQFVRWCLTAAANPQSPLYVRDAALSFVGDFFVPDAASAAQ